MKTHVDIQTDAYTRGCAYMQNNCLLEHRAEVPFLLRHNLCVWSSALCGWPPVIQDDNQ